MQKHVFLNHAKCHPFKMTSSRNNEVCKKWRSEYFLKPLYINSLFMKATFTLIQTCTCLHDGLQWTHSVEKTHQDTCQVTHQRSPEEEPQNEKHKTFLVFTRFFSCYNNTFFILIWHILQYYFFIITILQMPLASNNTGYCRFFLANAGCSQQVFCNLMFIK